MIDGMRYEGMIYRPPSEAYSLLVQVTIGCSHNSCTFCTMYRDKQFRVRPQKEVFEDLEWARRAYPYVRRIFLCDGDALCLSNDRLRAIIMKIHELFPECERVTVYGNAIDVRHKTDAELRELARIGMHMVYIGAESGSDQVLKAIKKGSTRDQLIEAVQRLEAAGIQASVTFINGVTGADGDWYEHAVKTGSMISEMNASYAALLTLRLQAGSEMTEQAERGEFRLMTPEELLREAYVIIDHSKPKGPTVFRSNHASNYLSLGGVLPNDRERLMREIETGIEHPEILRPEYLRAL